MQRNRLYVRLTNAVLLAMIAACAGCWEKIEYKAQHSSSTTPASTHPARPAASDHASPSVATATANPSQTEPMSGDATPPNETPSLPPASSPSPPKSDDDRYEVASSQPTTPDGASTPSSSIVTTEPSPPASSAAPRIVEPATTPPTLSNEASAPTPQPSKPEADERYASHSASPNTSPPPSTDATSVSKQTDMHSASNAYNSRHAAWILGSRLSLAALANDRQLAVKNVPIWFSDAQSAAKSLETTVPELPAPGPADASNNASKQVLDYLLVNGQRIGHDLAKHGPVESSLFEVALKSNLLLLIYRPGTPTVDTVSAALQEAAVRAKLPEKLWQPLILAINTQAPPKEVQTAIKKMHADVEQFLASGASPSGR